MEVGMRVSRQAEGVHGVVLRSLTAALVLLAIGSIGTGAAQEGPASLPNPTLYAHPVDTQQPIDQGAPRPYAFPRFGITLNIPARYSIGLGSQMRARAADFGMTPPDSGEYLFAELEPAGHFRYAPVIAGAISAIYLGVHLGTSRDECLAPLDFPRYKPGGTLVIDSNDFGWKQLPFLGDPRLGAERFSYRDYFGFVNSICYEFHVRVSVLERQDVLPAFEAILASAKFFPRNAPPRAAPDSPDTPFAVPADIMALLKLTEWKIAYPKHVLPWFNAPTSVCGTRELAQSNIIQFEHVSQADPAASTVEINSLESEVLRYLDANGWERIPTGDPPDLSLVDCFRKNDSVVSVNKGPVACSANVPCTQYGSYQVTAYLPTTP
jgi:hypothetical protein